MRYFRLLAFVLVILSAVWSTACASTPAPPTAAPVATSAPVPTNETAPTNAPAPTTASAPTALAPTATQAVSNNDSALPASLGAAEGKVYAFQVLPEQTTVEYAVDEVLFGNKQITRGKTSTVEGDFKLGVKDGKPYFEFSRFRVDLRTLKSDNGMRDRAIRFQWLESDKYPYADFVVKEIQQFPSDAQAGQEVKFQVTGDLTVREITKPATFDVTVKLDGDTLVGTGTTQVFMKDYGFSPPEILGRFTVSDPATITITGVAKYLPENS